MPVEDFYVDFARASFGDSVAVPAGRLFAKMDGVHMPQASDWKNGPGNLVANPKPWSEVRSQYAFVDELAALRPQVKGSGNTERFDYWLKTWQAMAAMAEACCARGQLDKVDDREELRRGFDEPNRVGACLEPVVGAANRYRQHPRRAWHHRQP